MRIFNYLKSLFIYSSIEKNGIIVLLIFCSIGILIIVKPQKQIVVSQKTESFKKNKNYPIAPKKEQKILEFKTMDINSDNFEKLVSAGMPEKIAKRIINFRAKGGFFRKKEDLLKIYGVDSFLFDQISPHLFFKEREIKQNHFEKIEKPVKKKIFKKIEINSADIDELMSLPMIGKYRAEKIIKYRESLGGFVDLSQLKEIYGFENSGIDKNDSLIEIDSNLIRKININTASIKELSAHPYIDYYLAKKIFEYRKINSSVEDVQNLVKDGIIERGESRKILLYLGTK